MNQPAQEARSGCIPFTIWGGWLATILSGVLGAALGAFFRGQEVASLRKELGYQQQVVEQRSAQLSAAIEQTKLQAQALSAARFQIERLSKLMQEQAGGSISPKNVVTATCSDQRRRLPDPQPSPIDGIEVVQVLVDPNGCWSESFVMPVGYKLWAIQVSNELEMGYPLKMPNPFGRIAGIELPPITTNTFIPLHPGERKELPSLSFLTGDSDAIRLRNRGSQMATATLLFKPV
jgi:hypothetical protein